jgi:flagellar motor switch protein FliM
MSNQEALEELSKMSGQEGSRRSGNKPRSIHNCNFRSAGRLSNENARSLTAIYETFARQLASVLDAYLGIGLEVKLQTLDQLPLKDHIANIQPLSYIVPFSLSTISGTMIVECDINLVFPIVELLLGGTGTSVNGPREPSEIEEEIMQEVMSLIARQTEQSWHMPSLSLVASRRIKSSLLHQYCPPNEKVTLVKFQLEVAGTVGSFQLIFPSSFLNILLKQIKLEQPQKTGGLRYFPTPSLRERILDCNMTLTAGFPHMKVAVRDLIALEPGGILKLRTLVRTPALVTVGHQDIFEAVPVRNGLQKAAQLGRRMHTTSWRTE